MTDSESLDQMDLWSDKQQIRTAEIHVEQERSNPLLSVAKDGILLGDALLAYELFGKTACGVSAGEIREEPLTHLVNTVIGISNSIYSDESRSAQSVDERIAVKTLVAIVRAEGIEPHSSLIADPEQTMTIHPPPNDEHGWSPVVGVPQPTCCNICKLPDFSERLQLPVYMFRLCVLVCAGCAARESNGYLIPPASFQRMGVCIACYKRDIPHGADLCDTCQAEPYLAQQLAIMQGPPPAAPPPPESLPVERPEALPPPPLPELDVDLLAAVEGILSKTFRRVPWRPRPKSPTPEPDPAAEEAQRQAEAERARIAAEEEAQRKICAEEEEAKRLQRVEQDRINFERARQAELAQAREDMRKRKEKEARGAEKETEAERAREAECKRNQEIEARRKEEEREALRRFRKQKATEEKERADAAEAKAKALQRAAAAAAAEEEKARAIEAAAAEKERAKALERAAAEEEKARALERAAAEEARTLALERAAAERAAAAAAAENARALERAAADVAAAVAIDLIQRQSPPAATAKRSVEAIDDPTPTPPKRSAPTSPSSLPPIHANVVYDPVPMFIFQSLGELECLETLCAEQFKASKYTERRWLKARGQITLLRDHIAKAGGDDSLAVLPPWMSSYVPTLVSLATVLRERDAEGDDELVALLLTMKEMPVDQ